MRIGLVYRTLIRLRQSDFVAALVQGAHTRCGPMWVGGVPRRKVDIAQSLGEFRASFSLRFATSCSGKFDADVHFPYENAIFGIICCPSDYEWGSGGRGFESRRPDGV